MSIKYASNGLFERHEWNELNNFFYIFFVSSLAYDVFILFLPLILFVWFAFKE